MAYFKNNEPYHEEQYTGEAEQEPEVDYDDGFDVLDDDETVPELSYAEKAARTHKRVRLALGAGNLFGVIAGTVLILLMLTLIFSMIHFVITDMGRSFSLFQTNF